MIQRTQSEEFYLANRAHSQKELKFLLTPFISTRLYVYFNNKNLSKRKKTFYANEHRCTYGQCLKNFVENIVLQKRAGYEGLLRLVDDIKGKYSTAKIYLREPGSDAFNILLREYNNKGEIVKEQDPPFTEDECQVLYYSIENGRVVIHEKEPQPIDFKSEIANNLK